MQSSGVCAIPFVGIKIIMNCVTLASLPVGSSCRAEPLFWQSHLLLPTDQELIVMDILSRPAVVSSLSFTAIFITNCSLPVFMNYQYVILLPLNQCFVT
jgi:hypothetical protein